MASDGAAIRRLAASLCAGALAAVTLAQCDSDADSGDSGGSRNSAAAETRAAAHVPVAGCESLVEQESARLERSDLVVGPVAILGARSHARAPRYEFTPRHGRHVIRKLPVLVQPGTRFVLSVDRRDRRDARLVYREKTRGARRVSEADPALRFGSCFDDSPTGWPGGFIVAGPRCVRIELDIKGRPGPVRRKIAFGRGTCG
jgi:hypothetical protein